MLGFLYRVIDTTRAIGLAAPMIDRPGFGVPGIDGQSIRPERGRITAIAVAVLLDHGREPMKIAVTSFSRPSALAVLSAIAFEETWMAWERRLEKKIE